VVAVLAGPCAHVEGRESVRSRQEQVPAVACRIEPDESLGGGLPHRFESLGIEDDDPVLVCEWFSQTNRLG
jgi:hypothetical protein